MWTDLDPVSLFLGALGGACIALIGLLAKTRRCTCWPEDAPDDPNHH